MNPKISSALKHLRPWATLLIIILLLKYTGAFSQLSTFAQTALLKTGMRDAEIAAPLNTDFNYSFIIKNAEGKPVDVNSFKGKVVFLNMWATWCGPCRAEMGSIQQLYTKLNSKDIVFLMLSVDRIGSEQKVHDYVQSKQFTFPVYTMSSDLPELLQVPSIPTTFIIDKSGKVVSKKVGTTNFDTPQFKTYLEQLGAQ
jgi:thiol-disulfide isomerase/thioredoxin